MAGEATNDRGTSCAAAIPVVPSPATMGKLRINAKQIAVLRFLGIKGLSDRMDAHLPVCLGRANRMSAEEVVNRYRRLHDVVVGTPVNSVSLGRARRRRRPSLGGCDGFTFEAARTASRKHPFLFRADEVDEWALLADCGLLGAGATVEAHESVPLHARLS